MLFPRIVLEILFVHRCIESRAINHISKTIVNRDTARHRYPIRYKLLFSFSSIEFLPKKKNVSHDNDIMSSTPPFQCYRSSQELEGGASPEFHGSRSWRTSVWRKLIFPIGEELRDKGRGLSSRMVGYQASRVAHTHALTRAPPCASHSFTTPRHV